MIAPHPPSIARLLSYAQRVLLIRHCVGPQPVVISDTSFLATKALMERGLIRGNSLTRPSETEFTYLGREVVCIVLGHYADMLMLVGPDYEQRLLGRTDKWREATLRSASDAEHAMHSLKAAESIMKAEDSVAPIPPSQSLS